MKSKEKQRWKSMVANKRTDVSSSNDDEDSDVEKNFALLTNRGEASGITGELDYQGEEEGDCSDVKEDHDDEEAEQESDDRNEGSEEEEGSYGQEGETESSETFEKNVNDDDEEEDDDDNNDPDPDDTGDGDEIQTKEDIRKNLSNMSFEDIMKLQNQVGTKVYNEVAYGSRKSRDASKKKRLNKNRPMEISAKKPTSFLRQVVPVKKSVAMRDPRFDDLSGEYKPEIFETTYKFINDIKHKEKEIVQKKLMKMKKNNKRKEKLQFLLKRLENQERARLSREQQRERELQFKRQQRERANHGDFPFFLKKSDKKKLQLADKYLELKKRGKLENFLSKKRKRNAGKDRKKLPKQLHSKKAL